MLDIILVKRFYIQFCQYFRPLINVFTTIFILINVAAAVGHEKNPVAEEIGECLEGHLLGQTSYRGLSKVKSK